MRLSDHKALNAIVFFAKNTKNCRKTKLFKLLYFLDFLHFKKYGTTVTEYDYIVMPFGPVPAQLYDQINRDSFPEMFRRMITFEREVDEAEEELGFKIYVKGRLKPDLNWFTPNERALLDDVAFMFRDATGTQISEVTHLRNSPWDKTKNEKGIGAKIDYFLAIDEETTLDPEEIEERYRVQKELRQDGRI